ncbi:MAG: nucleotide sugar dehydrogenase [Euryarchaeota archaeon]|nr:nucleotide sugar dehydrogenase [Euryarchaeota archaeon]
MDWKKMISRRRVKIAVFGLGYVGLPTALEFAAKGFRVVGVDVKEELVERLNSGQSHIRELNLEERLRRCLKEGRFTATLDGTSAARECDVSIICVPTPVTREKVPDLSYVIDAGKTIAKGLAKDKLVVLESTVHPTCTESELKPVLESSGLKAGRDFGLAYVPERYNPGDEEHTVDKIVRVVGAIDERWCDITAQLYATIARGVHRVRDIRTAEAAKIIENVQRDLNIALMNELALIFERLGVDVYEVIEAAATKWNFVRYYPGAGVGGHCLPVDPYYLTFKAQQLGFHPRVILAGRSVNDAMPHHVVELVVKGLNRVRKPVNGSKVVVLGVSYKRNTGDVRNTPSEVVIRELRGMGAEVWAYDPFVSPEEVEKKGARWGEPPEVFRDADCMVLVTDHDAFREIELKAVGRLSSRGCVLVDGRGFFDRNAARDAGFEYLGVGRG